MSIRCSEMGDRDPYIIIIDKHVQFSDALREFIISRDIARQVKIYPSIQQFMESLDTHPHPDLVLIDAMIIGKDSTKMLKEYLALNPQIRSIALSIFSGIPRFEELVSLGFRAYVNKNQVYTNLVPAIETTLSGGYHFPYNN